MNIQYNFKTSYQISIQNKKLIILTTKYLEYTVFDLLGQRI